MWEIHKLFSQQAGHPEPTFEARFWKLEQKRPAERVGWFVPFSLSPLINLSTSSGETSSLRLNAIYGFNAYHYLATTDFVLFVGAHNATRSYLACLQCALRL
jgi:hypothetical protein